MSTFVETDCTITHEGRTFESGGAVVTDEYIVAYIGPNGTLTDWHGNRLGEIRVRSSWRIHSYMSTHMHQIEAHLDGPDGTRFGGARYTGRSMGEGMIYRGRRLAAER